MSSKISALSAASALDGTEMFPLVQSSTTKKGLISDITTRALAALKASAANAKDTTDASHFLTPANLLNVGALRLLYVLLSADMNSTADQTFTKVGTFTTYFLVTFRLVNPSTSLTTAAGGIYTGASKSGSILVAASQTYTGATTSNTGANLTPAALGLGQRTNDPILSLTTGQGAPATADIYLIGIPLS